jgi:DNA polymerase III subunit epsilon
MPRSAHRIITVNLVWAGLLVVVGAVLLLFGHSPGQSAHRTIEWLAIGCWLAALFLILRSVILTRELGKGLAWIRTSVLNVVADRHVVIATPDKDSPATEITSLLQSLERFQDRINRERQGPDRRLVAVLGSLSSGVVVVTEKGQVSLLNNSAQELLGAERARVGTSIFAALSRKSVTGSMEKASRANRPIEALFERLDGIELQGRISSLPENEGAVIVFPALELDLHRPGLDFDLTLHDIPPASRPLALDVSLDELPLLILDTETTGLDAKTDRIVSFGAVCAHGTRLFAGHMIDDLVNPGIPIPAASTVIHNITDEMVKGARPWPELYAEFEALARNRVIVGHGVPFDLTVMRAECERHGQPWQDLVFIDTQRLASLLNPTLKTFGLENLVGLYQIDLRGRHTALGDSLVCAELFFRMVPRLQMQGFGTLGELLRFHCHDAVDVIAKQKAAGWITEQPTFLRQQHGSD